MKVTLESTTKVVTFTDGSQARVWEGATEGGVACYALIKLIGHKREVDGREFERDLIEHKEPSPDAIRCFDARFII